nr:hypothetical protein [uncultured Pseudodesulfovibrio sp.]
MCGIFAVVVDKTKTSPQLFHQSIRKLFLESELRGRESSGLGILFENSLYVHKESNSARHMLATDEYTQLEDSIQWDNTDSGIVAAIGHCRLVTNGSQALHHNNQPIIKEQIVAVHNGIITNEAYLWGTLKNEKRQYDVDTEVFLARLHESLANGRDLEGAWADSYANLEGSVSICALHSDRKTLVCATDNGSLYFYRDETAGITFFASEAPFIKAVLKECGPQFELKSSSIEHIAPKQGVMIDLQDFTATQFDVTAPDSRHTTAPVAPGSVNLIDFASLNSPENVNLRRCTKCILPETMPFIEFDEDGVCNFCNSHVPRQAKGEQALLDILEPHRKSNNEYDCLVGLSGGRDSTYGLYLLKEKFGMNPVAFTYDWGMVTDLARRNIYRTCGKLGVEHVLISADIRRKRENVRKNVKAWLKRPTLGMVPLFMAGDKQFYHHANVTMKKMGIDLMVFCENGKYERAHFKGGFCGINEGARRSFNISVLEKLKLFSYYIYQILINPSYINTSLIDSASAVFSTYFLKHDYLFLFEYIDWVEEEVNNTIISEFNWETSPDTPGTWRIGDGTAPFYNYIYHTIAGFTEHDTFRSNQIRYGVITRDEALRLSAEENKIRLNSLEWYANTIGFDLNEALCIINSAKKIYKTVNTKQ